MNFSPSRVRISRAEDEGRGWEEKLFRRNFAEFRLLGELRLRYDRVFPVRSEIYVSVEMRDGWRTRGPPSSRTFK